jgi:signal transduction histidine kinase
MKRSLTLKLTMAFVFISIIGVALTAIIIRQRTQREFDQFVLNRYQADLIFELAAYYEENGSWDGLDSIVVRTPGTHPMRRFNVTAAPITLVDDEGTVRYSGLQHRAGQRLGRGQMAQAVPVNVDGETVGWVQFAELPAQEFVLVETPESEFLANVNQAVILGTVAAMGVALLVGIFLARTISRPVREVTEATQVVAGGDLGYQVPVRTGDELGELAKAFNKMSADLAQSQEQRKQMTADIAHELRNPLSVILGYVEALDAGKLKPTEETFNVLHAKGQQLQHLIDELRTLALAEAGELSLMKRQIQPRMLLEHTILAHIVQAQDKDIQLDIKAEEPLQEILVDPDRMVQVLGNLVGNAIRHTPVGGQVTLSAEAGDSGLRLRVSDTGSGIDPADLPHVFNRFYRSDRSRQQNGASGLGLAIARSIVEAHGGTLEVEATSGEGTTFLVHLPS